MKKGIQQVYFGGKRVGERVMEEFVANHFGPYAGYAQLYLYHFWRQPSSPHFKCAKCTCGRIEKAAIRNLNSS